MRAILFISMVLSFGMASAQVPVERQDTGFTASKGDTIYGSGFPGLDTINYFIKLNCKYPKLALEEGLQGTVYVKIVINEQGRVSSTEVLKGFADRGGPGVQLDTEACNCLKNYKGFRPSTINGRPVKIMVMVPVKFKMQ